MQHKQHTTLVIHASHDTFDFTRTHDRYAAFVLVSHSPTDQVLFDEASQLPTIEALSCLCRARACVIVGDDQQLPPRDSSQTGTTTQSRPHWHDFITYSYS